MVHSKKVIETLERKTLVNKSAVEYATWGVNHVRGCLHDCKYCYARSEAKLHGRIQSDQDWGRLAIVENAGERVGAELDRKRTEIDRIHLSFTTDPFMYDAENGNVVPEVAASTLGIIRAINERDIPVTVLTKGVYPEFDTTDLHPGNQYGITAVSLNDEFREEWERGSAPVAARIEGLRAIANQGACTWVSVEPYPTPNLDASAASVTPLLEELVFIDKFIFGRLNYTPAVTKYLKEVDSDFYEGVAQDFVAWCEANGKPYHIKHSTPLHSPETVGLLGA